MGRVHRATRRIEASVSIWFEHPLAGRAEFRLSCIEARGDPADIGDGALAEAEGVTGASLLLLKGISLPMGGGRREKDQGSKHKS
jgi:hypothetical protein